MDAETQRLSQDELIVYEAVATWRHTNTANLQAVTGMPAETVDRALDKLVDRGMVELRDDAVHLGPNDWDLPNARD